MKKHIFIIITVILCLSLPSCSSNKQTQSNEEFSFRNIQLGLTYDVVLDLLKEDLKSTGYNGDFREYSFGDDLWFDSIDTIEVAGYPMTISAMFLFPSDNKENKNQSIFTRGDYYYNNINNEIIDDVFIDLSEKLVNLYGNPTEENSEKKYFHWESKTGRTSISLFENKKDSFIGIRYTYETFLQEYENKMMQEYNNIDSENNNGL